MTTPILGRLERVDPRTIWKGEASNFTPWLASDVNLALLGDTIGIDLEVDAIEKNVGPFRADILCKDVSNDSWVLIENQMEKTDHVHLGQLLTYAASLKAVTIVRIAREFNEEHRAALDWLNEITHESVNFFGLEIEAWKIGESLAAPKFNVVSKPNTWLVGPVGPAPETTSTQQLYLEYWTAFKAFVEEKGTSLKPRTPKPRHWMLFAIGRSRFLFSAEASANHRWIAVKLSIRPPNAKAQFHLLEAQREQIEKEVGAALQWNELPGRESSTILLSRSGANPKNREEWPQQHEWLLGYLERFHKAFSKRIKVLDPSAYIPVGVATALPDDEGELEPVEDVLPNVVSDELNPALQ